MLDIISRIEDEKKKVQQEIEVLLQQIAETKKLHHRETMLREELFELDTAVSHIKNCMSYREDANKKTVEDPWKEIN